MKLFFCDVETTGLDPSKYGLIQVAGIVEIDGEEVERFNYPIKPFRGDLINEKALEVNRITRDKLELFPEPATVYAKMMSTLEKYCSKFDRTDKFFFVGYNATFDDNFLRAFWQKNKDKYYGSFFWWPPIDVAVLAASALMSDRASFSDFKLVTVATKLGIEFAGDAHDAMADIEVTRQIYRKLVPGTHLSVAKEQAH